jgi:hypothetical protein
LTTNNIKIKRVKINLEKFEDTNGVIRCSKSKKDRQQTKENGQKVLSLGESSTPNIKSSGTGMIY